MWLFEEEETWFPSWTQWSVCPLSSCWPSPITTTTRPPQSRRSGEVETQNLMLGGVLGAVNTSNISTHIPALWPPGSVPINTSQTKFLTEYQVSNNNAYYIMTQDTRDNIHLHREICKKQACARCHFYCIVWDRIINVRDRMEVGW